MDDSDDDRALSAIYESIDSDLEEMDEYVTVSHPTQNPDPYIHPEPKFPAPSPPPLAPPPSAGGGGKKAMSFPRGKKKSKSTQNPFFSSSSSEASLLGYQQGGRVNPVPLPRKLPREPSSKYRKPGAPTPPTRPPKPPKPKDMSLTSEPLHRSGGEKSWAGPHHYEQQLPTDWARDFNRAGKPPPSQQSIYGNTEEEEEEEVQYDSIKETRKMIALKKKHHQQHPRGREGHHHGGNGEGGVRTLSQDKFNSYNERSSSTEEILPEDETRGGYSTVTCILLSITVATLLIAVASLAMSLYCITALGRTDRRASEPSKRSVAMLQCNISAAQVLNASEVRP